MTTPVFLKQDAILNPLKGVDGGSNASPAIGDLDGDGFEDLLIGNDNRELKYFSNDGSTLTEESDHPFDEVEVGPFPVPAIGDLDGDGDEDVLIGEQPGSIKYFRNEGDSFTELIEAENPFFEINEPDLEIGDDVFVAVTTDDNATPKIGDLDGDGDHDVLVGIQDGTIRYFRNEGDGFKELRKSKNPFKNVDVGNDASPAIGDLDGDGDNDVIVIDGVSSIEPFTLFLGPVQGKIIYFENNAGTFIQVDENPFENVEVASDAIPDISDIDGDGDHDVILGNRDGTIEYVENLTIDINDPPIAQDDAVGISRNNPLTIDVLKNDVEPEAEQIYLIEFEENTKAGGTVERDDNGTPPDLTDDRLIYTPPADFELHETDSFTYNIVDPQNQISTATVNILAIPLFVQQDDILNPFNEFDLERNAVPVIADLDGDGNEELLIGNGEGEIKYFLKNNSGFTEQIGNENPLNAVNVGYSAAPTTGDLDGDGDEDVLIGNWEGKLKYLRNDGDGFTELMGSDNPFQAVNVDYYASPTIFDVDGDGDEDVLVGDLFGNIKYFRNDGDGFTRQTGTDNPFQRIDVGWKAAPTVYDLDEDGDEDLLVGNDDGNIKYFRNDGGSFTEQKSSQNPLQPVNVGGKAASTILDVDGDGDEDLLVGNEKGKLKYVENLIIDVNNPPIAVNDSVGIVGNNPITINVLENDLDPEAEPISLIEFTGKSAAGGTVERDENGTPEELTDDQLIYTPPTDFSANESDSFTYTINQTATATVNVLNIPIFVEREHNLNPFSGVDVGGYANPAVGDLDGDNDLDVLIGNDQEKLRYFQNDAGTFTEVTGSDKPFNDIVVTREPSSAIADLDGDGDHDLLVGDEYGNLKYFQNNNGTFAEVTGSDNPLEGVNVRRDASPALGDLDGDGDYDLLVGDFYGSLHYFSNEGGTFTQLTGNNNPFVKVNVVMDASPTIVDFDGDGNQDVLVGNDLGKLVYFHNNQGTFSQLQGELPFDGVNGGGEATPAAADFDEDGDVDVLVGVLDGTLKYFENEAVDILTGTPASDTFVLGNYAESFYDNYGEQDYALIQNFDLSEDIIQLKGTAAEYQLGVSPGGLPEGTAIFLNSTELIGIVAGVDGLTLKDDSFKFLI
ncbi:MAG: VCBS repeat-containing protein [Gomphosphaeria aponina SAG 52.96 = DSM 107014]|uniref:VCBS repeat-containing protein n=1 Tax=Gomphosphaeria aponina SAG 52.96 = DSM 107014 TaxID=1521640 RepID=A0A941GWR5_9CHRO|nr:VCBS repeat-containing protein [Gomphosphaeria aponina SAG 52.96 = DSM 107014]